MTERSPLIQQAFQDEPLSPVDRERLWTTMQHRHSRQARWRNLMLAAVLLLAGAIAAGALVVRNALRSTSSSDRGVFGSIAVAADSISSDSPVEPSMIQETRASAGQETRPEVPSNLIPLLGHRSGLAIDLSNLGERREELAKRFNQIGPGPEHEALSAEMARIDRQIHSTEVAIEVIDRQLGAHHEPVPVFAPGGETIVVEPPHLFPMNGPYTNELMWITGGAGALLALGMVAILGYIRRLTRTTKEALSLIERQVSSQHVTLASGIDAIALEVERLGEGQRFMSKVMASDSRLEVKGG